MISAAELAKVKKGDVGSVFPMIVEKAARSWHMLPEHTRGWVTIHDLINDGVSFTVTEAVRKFKKNRSTNFSTYLYAALDNFYRYRTEPYRSEGRQESTTFSLDSFVNVMYSNGTQRSGTMLEYVSSKLRFDAEATYIMKIDIERQFIKLYRDSSPQLRRYLIKWFFQPRPMRVARCKELNDSRKEFRRLATQHSFTADMCRMMIRDQAIRIHLAGVISRRFHTIRHMKRDGTPALVEKYLHAIANS
jgi:hypothetical protein